MTRKEAIERILDFISTDERLNFGEKLTLMRIAKDISEKRISDGDKLYPVLLRLKYGVKQDIPKRWNELIQIPQEIDIDTKERKES